MKKLMILSLLGLSLTAVFATGCGQSSAKQIGVLLPVEHKALQTCEAGFVQGLINSGLEKDKDFTIVERNAGNKSADLNSFAKDLVANSVMTFGLGTDASKALKSASIDKGIVNPVLFSAVTDPVAATLVDSLENGKGFVTGTSDAQPIVDQINLVKECIPEADKIGIIYTQSEENSVIQAEQAATAANSFGLEVIKKTVTGSSDISATANALASTEGIDAIYVPTDNNIAANMNAIKEAANAKHVLIIAGEENMLASGGHISLSVNYFNLGVRTGEMAASILKGEKKASELPIGTVSKEQCEYVYSSTNLSDSGISIPQSVIDKCRNVL